LEELDKNNTEVPIFPYWFIESIKICSLRAADVISIALCAVIYTGFVLSFMLRAALELSALKK
jgi:hypothetical protein